MLGRRTAITSPCCRGCRVRRLPHLGSRCRWVGAPGALMAVAESTTRIRICPLVLNNDFHHPVLLAQELASIDHLSEGRLEVGLGAGHSFTEYAAIGLRFDPPSVRKARLAESVEIIRQLLDGDAVTYRGEHYQLESVRTLRSRQDHVPLLVGVNGKRALAHAARHADIIGLTMLGRTLEDGQHHEVQWQPAKPMRPSATSVSRPGALGHTGTERARASGRHHR